VLALPSGFVPVTVMRLSALDPGDRF